MGLLLAEEENLDDRDHAKPDQDKCANQCPRDLRLIDEPDRDGDRTKEGQAEDSLPDSAAEDQRCTTGKSEGDHDARPPPACVK